MSKRLRYGLIIGAVILVIALVVAKKKGAIGSSDATEVTIGKVEKLTLEETVIASGKIQPEVEVKLSPEVSGEIIELPIEEGQDVKKGDLVVRINPDIYQSAVNRAKAALNSSKAALASSKAQQVEAKNIFDRNDKLYKQKVISDAEYDAAKRGYDVANLNVESAQFQQQSAEATYREALDNLQRTTIYAPQDGTVSMLNVEIGERVVGTAQMAGTEIARIANLENMEVLVEVNENDIIRVSMGDTAIVEVDAYLDKEFVGVVTEIANSAQLTGVSADQVTNFEVKVRVLKESYEGMLKEGEKSPFRPGMTASVEIKTEKKKDVIAVPIESVTTRSDTSTKAKSYKIGREDTESKEDYEVVFLYADGKAKLQVVSTGIQDDENIEVLSGLEDGQQVITGPYSLVSKQLVNGDKVEEKDSKKEEKSKDK
ncbi:RND family efflux transporter, MFP subunit [Owenweeksia hongkongensis DSM 17368]|uniref:RND family efflux transporter, MFP subunit n=1 Tax=Owenweeksia hongkongensis (strain DSM 17368 / CIP 108786 / JCM 12287 / NRRL B-23963 / UST20020801) TaxID=926562 RepID=G8R1V2_OWEHD|nr:efflux RND transporter periplasmic adaptor subunit [Owenweeksia hongkongensis]AEV32878.1 RND family efflux transporter, MFP subunit [Owenweeksia hongkongensis DSM 17368]